MDRARTRGDRGGVRACRFGTFGLITKVLVDVNDRVTAGQSLALIDPSRLDDTIKQSEAAVAAAQATVAQNQATVIEARAQLNRFEEVSRLSGGRVPAKTEMDNARAALARAAATLRASQAQVVSQQAALRSNQTQRDKAIIRSPVNGVVLARQVDPGQTVAASFNTPTLFVIAEDLSQMELEVAIDEADVGQVKDGQKANFTTSTSSSTSSTTSAQVVSYGATLSVANAEQKLRPGMTATAEIVTLQKNNVLLVPNAALRFTPTDANAPQALKGVDLDIAERDFVAVMGPSGSGKSTTMNILGCLDVPTSGEFLFKGVHIETLDRDQRALVRRKYLGFVFQGFNLLSRTNALENVELPLLYRGEDKKVRHELGMAALEKVGLADWWDHTPAELSGGQQQRVAIGARDRHQPRGAARRRADR
ncbi:ABC transporter domain-containing protein [Ditylenchus destructor]|uniref:ABC transporter domain-containing protein n=1 Tax=Ditylenchus destructor TaxID=166010 RepID=A0AAD4QTJ1_9BILA|nr:ABC transporter domain-containing protein [Ditylenchus destructor]